MSKRTTRVITDIEPSVDQKDLQTGSIPVRIQLLERAWIVFPAGSAPPVVQYIYNVGEIIRDPELIQLIIDRGILYHEV